MMKTMTVTTNPKHGENGATLVALLALMTIIAITALAVAPNIVQEIQREKELESISRGEEVADAIKQYVIFYQGAKLPKTMDDLLEGLPQGTKKRQILRKSASIDPLSEDGKWRLVKPNGKSLINFIRRIQNYNGGVLPANPEPVRAFDAFFAGTLVNTINTQSDEELKDADSAEEVDEETENVPFIGVVSQSKSRAIIAYYGLENHSKWIFTPLLRGEGANAIQTGNGTGSGKGGAGGSSSNVSVEPQDR
jgi:type II secretory pathway pseudopilin PulG